MTGKTRLDKEKLAQNQHELESIGGQARAWRSGITRATVREKYRGAQGFLDRLRRLGEDPQHALPDIFIWMISGGRRVAYHRIKARTLLYRWEKGCQVKRDLKRRRLFTKTKCKIMSPAAQSLRKRELSVALSRTSCSRCNLTSTVTKTSIKLLTLNTNRYIPLTLQCIVGLKLIMNLSVSMVPPIPCSSS